MANWYMKGQSEYVAVNFHMGFYIDHSGFPEADYDTRNMESHGQTSDPFMVFGIDTGPATWTYGQQQVEIGLLKSHRIKFDTTGVYKWVGPGQDDWQILDTGGMGPLNDLTDVVITGTPADNELLAYDTSSSKWINQTPSEAGLATTGDLHSESHAFDSHTDPSSSIAMNSQIFTGLGAGGNAGESVRFEQLHDESHTFDSHTGSLPLTDIASYVQGSIIKGGGADWDALALGTQNYVLKAGATDVAWGQVAWGEVTGKPTEFTPSNHVLSPTTGPHTGTLLWTELSKTGSSLADLATRTHANLSDAPADAHHAKQHAMDDITQHTRTDIAVLDASTSFHGFLKKLDNVATNFMNGQGNWSVPAGTYSLEQHDNAYHSTNYHTEADGTGVITVHSGITSAGSGAIITDLERGDLHAIVTAGDLNHNDLANIDADDIKHISATQLAALHTIYSLEQHNNSYHSTNYAAETRVFEQSITFPAAPSEGDFHYDEDDDSWYRYNAEPNTPAWVEVGAGGGVAAEIDNLGNHTATEDLDMGTFRIINQTYVAENPTERNTTSLTYVKLKEITANFYGSLTVAWKFYGTSGFNQSSTRIYKNGVALGSINNTFSTSYITMVESVAGIEPDDLIQIYAKRDNAYLETVYVKDFIFLSNPYGTINESY